MKHMRLRPEHLVLACILLGLFLRTYRLDELPPGLFWDEAFDGFDALRILQTGTVPLMFEGNTGREPLTIYLQAIGMLLLGPTAWVLRLVPAMLGVLTIAAVYRVAAALFEGQTRSRWLAALSAGMLAVSFWHVDVSRLSLRVISFPLLSTLAVWAFWRAWSYRRARDFAWAGALLGLTQYTYLAARFLPVILLVFVLLAAALHLLQRRPVQALDPRGVLTGIAIMLGAMLAVFLPLGLYFVGNPGAFLLRTSYVSIFSSDPTGGAASLGDNSLRVIRMFIDRGDLEWRHNLAGRPALDIPGVVGFWIGLFFAIKGLAQPRYLLLLLWLGANLMPTLLSTEAPHFLRSIGALPAIMILVADGLARVWQRLVPRLGWQPLLLATLLFGSILTYHDYFDIWSKTRETFDAFDGPANTIIDRALTMSETGSVVLPLRVYGTPNMQFALAARFPGGVPVAQFDPNASLVWIAAGGIDRSVVVLDKSGIVLPQPLGDEQAARLGERLRSGEPIKGAFGQTLGRLVTLPNAGEWLAPITPAHIVDANFGNRIRMLGYDLEPATVKPGGQVRITFYWQALQEVHPDYFVTTNLLDPFGESFGQTILEPVSGKYPTSLWRRGAIIPDSFAVRLPADAHSGKYRFEVGLLDRIAFDRLLPLNGPQDRLLLAPITVSSAATDPTSIRHPLSLRLGEPAQMLLVGYDIQRAPAGDSLHITLYWRAERPAPKDYSVFVHLLDASGHLRSQSDGGPMSGAAPTSWWQPGDFLQDERTLPIPQDLAAGGITIELGVYDPTDGVRLPLLDADGTRQPEDRWLIPLK